MNIARLEDLAARWEARLLASARGEAKAGLNGYQAQGANMVLADVTALLAEGDDPPAPGHRRLTEIIRDIHRDGVDDPARLAELVTEYHAAANALLASQVEALYRRHGKAGSDRWAAEGGDLPFGQLPGRQTLPRRPGASHVCLRGHLCGLDATEAHVCAKPDCLVEHQPYRAAGHLGAPGTGCPLCLPAADPPGFSVCTERCGPEVEAL